jgi:hypothetical protein
MASPHLVSVDSSKAQPPSPSPAVPDDGRCADAVSAEQLGDAIADLAARIHAATHEVLVLIQRFDACDGWSGTGALSCAHWLNWRIGLGLGAAREKVRVAHALANLPLVSAAMQRGALSFSKVRAITRVATPDNEARLVDLALSATASQMERFARAWRRVDRTVAAEEAAQRHLDRQLDVWVDDDGMVVLRGRLTPEVGAVVQRAIEAAAEQLRRESATADDSHGIAQETTASQRRADALGLLAETALAHELDRGTAGNRYQVVLHVDGDHLQADGDTGQAVLEDSGTYVPAETSQRIACDASLVVMRHAPDGTTLDVGRKTRTIPPAIRRGLAARDRQCRFPGCSARHCDAHHIRHWADGGATSLNNLVFLCRRHHRSVHEERFTVTRHAGGALTFQRPDGISIPIAPAMPEWSQGGDDAPLAPTTARLADASIEINPYTATPRSNGERLDLAWALDVLYVPAETPARPH